METLVTNNDFVISTDKSKIDVEYLHKFLSGSYWAAGISVETVQKSIEGSLCFGVYHNDKQVGFARIITDGATFAYLADVFIDENYRGRGLSKWLMEAIVAYPGLQGLRRIMLATRDGHGLYAKFGFTPLTNVATWMQIHNPDVYKNK